MFFKISKDTNNRQDKKSHQLSAVTLKFKYTGDCGSTLFLNYF